MYDLRKLVDRFRTQVSVQEFLSGPSGRLHKMRYGDTMTIVAGKTGFGIKGVIIRFDGPDSITISEPRDD